jgi:hypothetical protein
VKYWLLGRRRPILQTQKEKHALEKRRKTEEDCLRGEEVVVSNGTRDTRQTVSSNVADIHSIKMYSVGGREFSIPLSESSVAEITVEDINSIFEQVSDRPACMDSNTAFSESVPLTEYKHINNPENNSDYNLSWLINFKGGELLNADEVQHNRNCTGQEAEETTCPGTSYKCSDHSLSVLYSIPFILTNCTEPSLRCASDSLLRINTFRGFRWAYPFPSSQTLLVRSNLRLQNVFL